MASIITKQADGSYVEWDDGAVPPVPDQVSNFQGRTALRMASLFDQAQAAVAAIPDETQRAIAQDAFDRGAFVRGSGLLEQFRVQLGLDEAQRDALFRQAATIEV